MMDDQRLYTRQHWDQIVDVYRQQDALTSAHSEAILWADKKIEALELRLALAEELVEASKRLQDILSMVDIFSELAAAGELWKFNQTFDLVSALRQRFEQSGEGRG